MPEAPAYAIEVSGLRKTYDGHTYAVDGVDLSVPRVEVFGAAAVMFTLRRFRWEPNHT